MTPISLLRVRDSRHIHLIILIVTLISSVLVIKDVIIPNVDARIEFEEKILSGDHDSPYQYRILKPLIAKAIQLVVVPLTQEMRTAHIVSHAMLVGACFLLLYYLFFLYLRRIFTEQAAITGLVLLALVIPLATTGYYMVGDFLTLMFFAAGFALFFNDKDQYLPAVIFVGAFNRQQIIILLVFYVIHLYSTDQLFKRSRLAVLVASVLAFGTAWFAVRFYFGFKPDPYPILLHTTSNMEIGNLVGRTIPLWTAQILGFAILSALSFKNAGKFFRLSFIFLAPYALLFFLKGYLWELAKFLPVYLILIPMSLKTVFKDDVSSSNDRGSLPRNL